jgi:hypothetical protein
MLAGREPVQADLGQAARAGWHRRADRSRRSDQFGGAYRDLWRGCTGSD